MDIQYVYTRKRSELARATNFSVRPAEILVEILPNLDLLREFIYRNPVEVAVQNSIQFSSHEVNTSRTQVESKGIDHREGGWPKDVHLHEEDQLIRYRKKIEKDQIYLNALQRLVQDLQLTIEQSNALDIHQLYFSKKIDESDQPFHAQTVNLYSYSRNAHYMPNQISWQTDEQRKIAVAYPSFDLDPIDSLIWDVEIPNQPALILQPRSSLTTVQFNPKDAQQILAGCVNGQLCLFDLRKGLHPVDQSMTEFTHRHAIRDARWLQSKTGTEFFSVAADGMVYWWDTKKMNEPVDRLLLDLERKGRKEHASPITTSDYDSSLPSKFLLGTETGQIVQCSRKGQSDADRINVIYPGHAAAICSLHRHPFFSKIFLSIGDWTTRIWSEEVRDDSILSTRPNRDYLTGGQWSPTRPAVFVTSNTEGSIQIWDLLFKQDEPALTMKISEEAISCLSYEDQGRYIACGTKNGNVTLIELSDSLSLLDRNEKSLVSSMFDRETRRTRLLESRTRFKQEQHLRTISTRLDDLQQFTDQFWSMINDEKRRLQQDSQSDNPFSD